MCKVDKGQKDKKNIDDGKIQSTKRPKNQFISCDPVTAPTLTKIVFNIKLESHDMH